MTSCSGRFLVVNGAPHSADVPSVSAFLESTSGAYTTTRTHGNASVVLFWERHLRRLADSARILAECRPDSFSAPMVLLSPSMIRPLVEDSLRTGLQMAFRENNIRDGGAGEELAITSLVRGVKDEAGPGSLDVYVHIGVYAPPFFGDGARLALVGRGRDIAAAKYSEWVRIRKYMENFMPPSATEPLLSNDGNHILEGSVTNFFVVRSKVVDFTISESSGSSIGRYPFEVQTAPLTDGLLPGIIRQLVIEICSSSGIPFREVAPSWSERELWKEAFITSSLRLLQHVETIQAPNMWKELHSKTWEQVSWVEKQFERRYLNTQLSCLLNENQGPGIITTAIQRALLERATTDGFPITEFL